MFVICSRHPKTWKRPRVTLPLPSQVMSLESDYQKPHLKFFPGVDCVSLSHAGRIRELPIYGLDRWSRTTAAWLRTRNATVTLYPDCLVPPQGFDPCRSSPSDQSPELIRFRRAPAPGGIKTWSRMKDSNLRNLRPKRSGIAANRMRDNVLVPLVGVEPTRSCL